MSAPLAILRVEAGLLRSFDPYKDRVLGHEFGQLEAKFVREEKLCAYFQIGGCGGLGCDGGAPSWYQLPDQDGFHRFELSADTL